ncbi:MAG TPA: hypothetical protein DCF84_00750 [Bacteroidetes bacterium]|nr:hypothetical protein [Bacteroidota bacterium]
MIFYKLYLLIGLLEVMLEFLEVPSGVFVVKPMLMPLLALAFWQENTPKHPFKLVLFAALVFSWIGDVVLLFQLDSPFCFILGLCAFLTAHLLYIWAMSPGLEFSADNRLRRIVTFVAVLVLTILLVFYFEKEGNRAYSGIVRFAVPLYSLVLALMVLAAAHQGSGGERHSILLFSGALFFMFSDLLIALGAFSNALAFLSTSITSGIIMATYILSQFLIIRGMMAHHDRIS